MIFNYSEAINMYDTPQADMILYTPGSIPVSLFIALLPCFTIYHDSMIHLCFQDDQPLWLSSSQSHDCYEQHALQLRRCNQCNQ